MPNLNIIFETGGFDDGRKAVFKGYTEFCKKNYTDINFYLPFTDTYDTNTIWYETKENLGDYSPMCCNYGELVQWDGTNLSHGNKINITEDTRISIDFRITTESYFYNNTKKSKNTKTVFAVGGYYNII